MLNIKKYAEAFKKAIEDEDAKPPIFEDRNKVIIGMTDDETSEEFEQRLKSIN